MGALYALGGAAAFVLYLLYCDMSAKNGEQAIVRGKRGPYKRYLTDPNCRVPKQTRCNWKRLAADTSSESESDHDRDTVGEMRTETLVREKEVNEDSEMEAEANEEGVWAWEAGEWRDGDAGKEESLDSEVEANTVNEDYTDSESSTEGNTARENEGDRGVAGSPAHSSDEINANGPQVSVEEGIMLILNLAWRHKLTNIALSDVLKVICFHLPENSIPAPYKSLYRLLKSVSSSSDAITHRLCGMCGAYLQLPK